MKIIFIISFLFLAWSTIFCQENITVSESKSFFSVGYWNEADQDVQYAGLQYKPGEKFWFSIKPYHLDNSSSDPGEVDRLSEHVRLESINAANVILKILRLKDITTFRTDKMEWQLVKLNSYECNPIWTNVCGEIIIPEEGIYKLEIYDGENKYLNQVKVRVGYDIEVK